MPRRLRRSVLFTPGDRPDRIAKALAAAEADTLVMDWEDAVSAAEKPAAREKIRDAFPGFPKTRTERVIRVNGPQTPWHKDDVVAAVPLQPDALMLPKAERPVDVERLAQALDALEGAARLPPGRIKLLLIVESPLGVLNALQLAQASSRVDALVFGAEDYQAEMGGRRRRDNLDVLHARTAVAIAARATRLGVIDQVFVDFNDADGLREEASFARDLGYTGKMIIHPKQIAPVHEVFTPSKAEIDHATRVLAAAEAAEREGRGAFALDGKMVDRPVIEQAKIVVEQARQAGILH